MLGKTQAEVALTKKLAATLVQREVIEPMNASGWGHGQPVSGPQAAIMIAEKARADGQPEEKIAAFLKERGITYLPPAGGQPAPPVGAPTPAPAAAAPVASGQPAPVAAAPVVPVVKTDVPADLAAAQNVLTLMESLKDSSGKIMGKYATVDEALKGAGHLANMAKDALRRAEAAEARAVSTPGAPVAAPSVTVPVAAPVIAPFSPASRPGLEAAKTRLATVLARVKADGFDGDSAYEFAEANREVAEQTTLAVRAEEREREDHARRVEQTKWQGVNAYMAEKYPESLSVSDDEFGVFMQSNPRLARALNAMRAQGQEIEAAEFGYTEFAKSRGTLTGAPLASAQRVEDDLAERERVRLELRDKALIDAGVVHGSAGGSSAVETPGIVGPSQEDINQLADRMRREGEAPGSPAAMAWRQATIGRFLPPDLFGPR
jgi:hypothetical protein